MEFNTDILVPISWFKECAPKILVVTDSLTYSTTDDFGLTEFVAALRASTIHAMTPVVVTAQFNPDPLAALSYDAATRHIANYKFTDTSHGLRKSRYDVVFLFGRNGRNWEFAPTLTDESGAIEAVTAFMQAGGGVFATGDHEDLGAGMCMDIPRVRHMRYWTANTPSASGFNRLTTTLPGRGDVVGSNDQYEFNDQSDQFPQRLYVNYRTNAGGEGNPHPLLQVPASARAIEVFPDHPHEGECIIPSDLTTKLADGATDEWPLAIKPEMAALTMSHGNAFPGKVQVTPRSFIAVCAYDGHNANVGRVVTDATWHHFVNVNIKPGMSALAGRDLADIKQYYVNLATWLMPKYVRRCRRFPWILSELRRYPLFEEIPPIPLEKLDGPRLREIGQLVESALRIRHTHAEVKALIDDGLEEAIGVDARRALEEHGREVGANWAYHAGLSALGSLTVAIAERFAKLKDKTDINGEKAFAEIGKEAATVGVKRYLSYSRKQLGKFGEIIDSITH